MQITVDKSKQSLSVKRRSTALLGLMMLTLLVLPSVVFAAFTDESASMLPAQVQDSYAIASGDVDADGDKDLVIANAGQTTLLLNDGTGVYTDATGQLPTIDAKVLGLALGDVDGDNDLDLFLTNTSGPNLLLINDGTGNFTDESGLRLPGSVGTSVDVVLVDLNQDNALDAVVARRGSANLLLLNNGSGVYSAAPAGALPTDLGASQTIAVADVQGDGTIDLFVGNDGGQNRLLLNNGLGGFTDVSASFLPVAEDETLDSAFIDVDGDGDFDLLLANGAAGLVLLLNDAGSFAPAPGGAIPALNSYAIAVAVGDIDFDGSTDILVANAGQDHLLLNNGAGLFTDATATDLPSNDGRSFGAALVDVEGDFDLDFVVAVPKGQNRSLLNQLAIPRIHMSVSPDFIAVGDDATIEVEVFDEDGLASTILEVNGVPVPLDPDGVGIFVPTAAGSHVAVVTAEDSLGNIATRTVSFNVDPPDLTAPEVTLTIDAPALLLVGQSVTIQATATDNESGIENITVSVNGTPVTLDTTGTGVFITSVAGLQTVVATATDLAGNSGLASDTFSVLLDSVLPVVTLSASPDPVDTANPVEIIVTALDNVAVSSLVLMASGPGITGEQQVEIGALGEASFTPYVPGTFTLTARALDPSGNEGLVTTEFEAVGEPDVIPPTVTLSVVPGNVAIGGSVMIAVSATDDLHVASVSLEINGTPVVLDSSGAVEFTPPVIGSYTATGFAADPTGNVGSTSQTFQAVDPATDTEPPVVAITSPGEESEITSLTDIIGTVNDLTLTQYTLAIAPVGGTTFSTIATGTNTVEGGMLGTLDPTTMRNGYYRLKLTAVDVNGKVSAVTIIIRLKGENKVGNFTISFQDLIIPVSGIPITVTRTYDSRVKTKGDFGIGWRLDVKSMEVQENRVPGVGWQVVCTQTVFGVCLQWGLDSTVDHSVIVTMDGSRDQEFVVEDGTTYAAEGTLVQGSLYLSAKTGTYSTLAALDNTQYDFLLGDELTDFGLNIVNPNRYQLTRNDGTKFVLNQNSGIERITDANGNIVVFGADGIIHSAGKSVTFTRDAQGRITTVTDPMGNTIEYAYDTYGDLVRVTDQAGSTTQFAYNSAHGLVEMVDPQGEIPIRQEYDSEGRLIAVVDTQGNRLEFTHDLSANTEVVRDRLGNVKVFSYDDDGNILSEIDALGNTTSFTYDADGNQLSKTDALGNTIFRTYDEKGNELTITDPLGNVITRTYDTSGNVLTEVDAVGNITTNSYDSRGNLLMRIDGSGDSTSHSFDLQGNQIGHTDGLGNVFEYQFDGVGNRTRAINSLGNQTNYQYNANGKETSESTTWTDSSGTPKTVVTYRNYDSKGRLIRIVESDGSETSTEYDTRGNRSAEIDANGNRIVKEYDAYGNMIRTLYPDGTEERSIYDAENHRTGFVDRLGRTTNYQYDALGRLEHTVFPDGSSISSEFDIVGREVVIINESGNRTQFEYDAAGRKTKVTDALGNVMTFTYDANANRITEADASDITTSFLYDPQDRLIQTHFPGGTQASSAYDSVGKKISETDQAGQATFFEYNALGRLVRVADALGGKTTYTYDELGNQLTQTDAEGHTTSWTYDSLGRVLSRILPLGMAESFSYDAKGNRLNHTDFNGDTTTYVHDTNDQLVLKTNPAGSTVEYTYLFTGQVATVTDSRGVTTFSYDLRDRLLHVDNPDGSFVRYTYDNVGNKTSIETASGVTSNAYDALNRLVAVTDSAGAVTNYGYDAKGNRISLVLPTGSMTTYTYDSLNRLTRLENARSDASVISSYGYTLDPVGNRVRVIESDGRMVDYAYDALHRLTREGITDPLLTINVFDYSYDGVGNRISQSVDGGLTAVYEYDDNDRLLSQGGATFSYDNNGNRLSKTQGGDLTSYSYNFDGRLVRTETMTDVVDYAYDADGNRVSKTVNGLKIRYVFDRVTGNNSRGVTVVLEEHDEVGALVASFVWGDDLITQHRSGIVRHYFYDGLGSTRALTNTMEAVTDTYTFDSFGELLASTGSSANDFRFAGEQLDPKVGFYNLRARYYDSSSGRFVTMDRFQGISSDPVSLHKYLYANANPVNFTDPSGYFTLTEISVTTQIQGVMAGINYGRLVGVLSLAHRLTQVAATTAVASCGVSLALSNYTSVQGADPCKSRGQANVFHEGADTPSATAHHAAAIAQGHKNMLNKSRVPYPRGWMRSDPRCKGNRTSVTGLDCDEYPYASTQQGGRGASLRKIPSWDNRLNGTKLRLFYAACNVSPDDPVSGLFAVIQVAVPSLWQCKD